MKRYDNSCARHGGAVEPTDESNAMWYDAMNNLTPSVNGISKQDFDTYKHISG